MINFTSSLYLGMKHSSAELQSWDQLTLGVPAALSEYSPANTVADKVAAMQGLQKGLTANSTLHVYWDLFGLLSKMKITLFIDEKVYPVSCYGLERLSGKGINIYYYKHLDAEHLHKLLQVSLKPNTQPVILTDGWCPVCAKPAAIDQYVEIARRYKGTVIVDDTQSFGIYGIQNKSFYGSGGGGILQWLGCKDMRNVVSVISLAKAFGTPLAVISGTEKFIAKFITNSTTRINSSPASIPHIHAAVNALKINAEEGDWRRQKLYNNVLLFKNEMSGLGCILKNNFFPVQIVRYKNPEQTMKVFNLLKKHLKTILIRQHNDEPVLLFIIRSDHSAKDIKHLSACLQNAHFSITKHLNYEYDIR